MLRVTSNYSQIEIPASAHAMHLSEWVAFSFNDAWLKWSPGHASLSGSRSATFVNEMGAATQQSGLDMGLFWRVPPFAFASFKGKPKGTSFVLGRVFFLEKHTKCENQKVTRSIRFGVRDLPSGSRPLQCRFPVPPMQVSGPLPKA